MEWNTITELLSPIRWNSHPPWKCYWGESSRGGTFPASDRNTWLSLLFIPKACFGRVWQGLEEVCEKYISNSYLQMLGRPLPSQICACAWPRTHWGALWSSPAALTHKMRFRANCCKLLLECDGCHPARRDKNPLMYVFLMYSGRWLNGSTHVTQLLTVLRFERSWVCTLELFPHVLVNFLFNFFQAEKANVCEGPNSLVVNHSFLAKVMPVFWYFQPDNHSLNPYPFLHLSLRASSL